MADIVERAKAIEGAAMSRLDSVFSDPDGRIRSSKTGQLVSEEDELLLRMELSALEEMALETGAEMQQLNAALTEALRRSTS